MVRRVAVRAALGDVVAVVLPDGLSPRVMSAEAVNPTCCARTAICSH
jgi:hypothetical protein